MAEINKLKLLLEQQAQEISNLKEKLNKEKNNFEEKITYLENILHKIPGNVYWLDKDNRFLGCNFNQAKLAGLMDPKEIIGKTNADMPWKQQAGALNDTNKEVMKIGKLCVIEESAVMLNGPGVYLSHKIPLRNNIGEVVGILGASFDITENKKLRENLLNTNKKLELSNKVKSEFIANAYSVPSRPLIPFYSAH